MPSDWNGPLSDYIIIPGTAEGKKIWRSIINVLKYKSHCTSISATHNSYSCSNLLYLRNFQEQVRKAFCYQKLFWLFTVCINCSSDLKMFEISRPSASNFRSFSRSIEQFFHTILVAKYNVFIWSQINQIIIKCVG